jgi:3-oxosteroid 1-dehydrogenase
VTPPAAIVRSTADLVVVGSGAAGLTGALVAALGGARVVVIEKADQVGGTTAISGGGAWIPANHLAASVGVQDSREEALEYMRACAGELADEEILLALVDNGDAMLRHLEDEAGLEFQVWPPVGGCIDYRPWLPGAKLGGRTVEVAGFSLGELGEEWEGRVRVDPGLRNERNLLEYYRQKVHLAAPDPSAMRLGRGGPDVDRWWRGTALVGALLAACLDHGVDVRTGTPARQLVVEDGRVVGVEAAHGDEVVELRAPHVMMATGGYAHNDELKKRWLTTPLTHTCEAPTNEGDGHLMGIAVGAQVSGLGDAWWNPQVPMPFDGAILNSAGTREDRGLPHTMMVNPAGKRFMNEAVNYYDAGESFGNKVGAAPRNYPAWFVFDQQGVDRYAILAYKVPPGDRPEWLHVADTVEGLAESLGVDAGALRTSVERFNDFARTGIDEDFHRGEDGWDRAWGDPDNLPNPSLGTLEKAPYYATPVWPGAIATRGGLRIDATGRVLGALDGAPIAGLYASGNCSNGAVPGAYVGPGATIGPAMTFGYIIGRQVVESLAHPTID